MDTTLENLPIKEERKKRIWKRAQRKTATFYLFVSPWILGFLLLIVIPLIVAILASLTNYDGLSLNTIRLVGFSNYERALTNIDVDVKFSFTRTVMWGLFNLPTWVGISFGMALILNQNLKARGLFRTIYYIPSIVPLVASMTAWKVMLDKNVGWLNGFLSLFWPGTAIGWLSEHALTGMTIVAVWTGLGTAMIIFLAGLQNIPDELVEAARIDGANGLQIFRSITMPLMTPVIFLQLIMGLIGVFQQLNLPLVLTQVGISRGAVPPRQIYLFMYHVYRQMFVSNRWGYGIALILIMFVVVAILTIIVFWTEKYWVYSDTQGEGA